MTLVPDLDGYVVRHVPAFRASKDYLCPECAGPVPPGTGHVVVWPDHDAERRRHLHLHCWRVAVRRGRVDGV